MWKEAIMALFVVLSWHMIGGTEKTCDNLSQDNLCPTQDFSQAPPEYKAEESPLESQLPWLLIICIICVHELTSSFFAVNIAMIRSFCPLRPQYHHHVYISGFRDQRLRV
jgi:hypothetical protein